MVEGPLQGGEGNLVELVAVLQSSPLLFNDSQGLGIGEEVVELLGLGDGGLEGVEEVGEDVRVYVYGD